MGAKCISSRDSTPPNTSLAASIFCVQCEQPRSSPLDKMTNEESVKTSEVPANVSLSVARPKSFCVPLSLANYARRRDMYILGPAIVLRKRSGRELSYISILAFLPSAYCGLWRRGHTLLRLSLTGRFRSSPYTVELSPHVPIMPQLRS